MEIKRHPKAPQLKLSGAVIYIWEQKYQNTQIFRNFLSMDKRTFQYLIL